MFLQAFEELDDKSMSKLQETVVPATKKDRHAVAVSQLIDQSAMAGNRPFAKPVSSKDIEQVMKSAVPEKTQQDNKYCAKLWHDWVSYRRKETNVIIPSLHNITSTELQHWMCPFILEVRKKDGSVFLPNTLHHICCGIMRFVRANGIPTIDIFKDKEFAQFRKVLDSEMKRLQSAGIGTTQRQAEPITFAEEEILWEKGILGDSTPQCLVDTMLYMNGLYFSLRGGKEHRDLRHRPSQIQLIENAGERPYLTYKEDISKNHPGGLRGRKIKPKVVIHHANIEKPERCFVRLYKLYNSLCPSDRPDNAYYLKPLQKPLPGCWYSSQPIGHTKLGTTINRMCQNGGILGYRTNHSLRTTVATRLHQSGCIDEQRIMERTGHRSVEAVHYKQASKHQQEQVSDILNNGCIVSATKPKRPHCDDINTENTIAQVNSKSVHGSLSLEYSSSCTPVFNISSCSSVTINYAGNK